MVQSNLKGREAYRLLFPAYPDVVDIPQFCDILTDALMVKGWDSM